MVATSEESLELYCREGTGEIHSEGWETREKHSDIVSGDLPNQNFCPMLKISTA